VPWSLSHLADELAALLRAREAELALEQAVRGLDHCDERALQGLLAGGLGARYEVAREVHYPSSEPHSKRSHRLRCDLVLGDPALPERLWLEVKVAHQHRPGGQHNARYAQQWRRSIVGDLRKLKADGEIRTAALALVAFTADEAIFAKDAQLFEQLLLDEELICGFRSSAGFAIQERIGHRRCDVALWPLV
jgi:hypothetical protein